MIYKHILHPKNIQITTETEYSNQLRITIIQTVPLLIEISYIIYQFCISQRDIDTESNLEITAITAPDPLTTEYISTYIEEEEWITQRALEQQIISTPNIISVSWSAGNITIVTESDLYWGNY